MEDVAMAAEEGMAADAALPRNESAALAAEESVAADAVPPVDEDMDEALADEDVAAEQLAEMPWIS
mgnify:CR=1 FL=1